jgi:deazaflavin-dependent oxidoreductase (nitroreductase family)
MAGGFGDEPVHDNPTDWVAKHMRTFLESGGAKGNTFYGRNSLLLTTRGRRTGKLRRTALWYFGDGERYLLVGSNGGLARHPAWYLNLLENPDVEVQVRGERFAARARPADAQERPALWERLAAEVPQYAGYQKKLRSRELPVVIVERAR